MTRGGGDTDRMIAESARDLAERTGGLRRARALRDRGTPFDADAWRAMAGLGWIGACASEARGGLGLGLREACILLEALGRKLVPEPLAAGIAAALLLDRCGGAPGEPLLARLVAGEVTCTLARAPDGGAGARAVAEAIGPSHLLVAAAAGEEFTLRALTLAGAGVEIARAPCVDGSELADVTCSADALRRAPVLCAGPGGAASFEAALAAWRLLDAAYLVGLMDEALRLTIAYLGDRVQFGVPLSGFQALQHRAASCYVDVTATRALVREAARAFGTPQHVRASAAAKARAAAAALRVAQEAVQLHGSVGFADEHDIGLYLRRAMAVVARTGGELENERLFAQGAAA